MHKENFLAYLYKWENVKSYIKFDLHTSQYIYTIEISIFFCFWGEPCENYNTNLCSFLVRFEFYLRSCYLLHIQISILFILCYHSQIIIHDKCKIQINLLKKIMLFYFTWIVLLVLTVKIKIIPLTEKNGLVLI